MQISETPQSVEQLDLMKRLDAYAKGEATWCFDNSQIGPKAKSACSTLHSSLVRLVNQVFAPVLSRTTAHEMEMFTMHDPTHARKVAHLMWHILDPDKREYLTPPEIGMMVAAAYLHDLGMALSPEEREARLDPESDLWDKLELRESQKLIIEKLREQGTNPSASETMRMRARRMLCQAEEALLCQDTRERHATRERYEEVLSMLAKLHQADAVRIPDIKTSLSFDGDSFLDKLIDVCEAHRGDAEVLVQNDGTGSGRPRFPSDYPVGFCNADLHMVAAALRLADILDFDRERTPPVLFHYLLPGTLGPEHRSVLEWSKHLTISNWHIEPDAIVFRGRCNSHIIHHAVVQFCEVIADEISATRATFGALQESRWPFILPSSVKADIHEEGYRYVAYRFELDDERVYELLMGGAIYDNPLVAVRELVQNAVDACKLRDAMTLLHEPHMQPRTSGRIIIRYEEPTEDFPQPRLIIKDTGTGMDALILERWFLKVGRSYYRSSEFNQTRIKLRKANLDFAPVSEFGIGFLSSFLLAEQVKFETAMWEPIHKGDIRKHTLWIDGPTRLIRLEEGRNEGPSRFKGTWVTLFLSHGGTGSNKTIPPTWEQIKAYLKDICQDLTYRLNLEHVSSDGHVTRDRIDPLPLTVELSPHLEPLAIRIQVDDQESGLEGEIALINPYLAQKAERDLSEESPVQVIQQDEDHGQYSALLRGGFKIGPVPGLPDTFVTRFAARARLRFNWKSEVNRRYPMPNLARNGTADSQLVAQHVFRLWLVHLLEHVDKLPEGLIYHLGLRGRGSNLLNCNWLERYDALALYRLARQGWDLILRKKDVQESPLAAWEDGTGASLWLGTFRNELHWQLLDLILPKITTLQMGPQASFHVTPPEPSWRAVLEGWYDYITSPVQWELFVEYIGGIENLLAYEYTGVEQLNSRFRDRLLTSFREDEFVPLLAMLRKLAYSRGWRQRQAELTEDENTLFRRALEVVGDLEIGSLHGSWRIDSFAPLDVSQV